MGEQVEVPFSLAVLDMADAQGHQSPSTLASLSHACQEWGFFRVANHGIPRELLGCVSSLSKELFSLPPHSKDKAGPSSSLKTYTPPFIVSPFFESFRVSGPDFAGSAKSTAERLLEEPRAEFWDALGEYGNKMVDLSRKIMAILLTMLGEGMERYHESEFGRCHGYLRINSYSPNCKKDGVEGLGMHTDMSCITILYQDAVGGLQVRSRAGEWVDVSPCEETLVVNIGDLLQAWCNGRLRSSYHRVLSNGSNSRLSLAFFWSFEDEKVVRAPQELIQEGRNRVYKPFLCLDYVRFREEGNNKEMKEKVGRTVDDFALDKAPFECMAMAKCSVL
ncbi:gibberellin 20-oxidase-like protein [Nymphaea colorata]|nr:gibberellin 20-oxidase-like protein [Nymphaea colorata]